MRRLRLSGTAALALATAASSSSAGIVVPILLLLIAAAASGSSDEGTQESDRRLKTDAQWMGMRDGLAVYSWRYLDRPVVWQGLMAQDLLARRPDAVVPRHDGMLAVDYTRLPVTFRRLH